MEEVVGSIPSSSTTERSDERPASGWSLAGFVAGEGCFSITRKLPPFQDGDPRLRFVFAIETASRDRPLLDLLCARLAIGKVTDHPQRRAAWQPTSTFRVASLRAHRSAVIPFMDRFLVAGQKRHHFELWVQAIDAYELAHPTRWGNGPSPCRVHGCEKPVRGRGLCRSHYYRETGH
jgi:hypothetical protein